MMSADITLPAEKKVNPAIMAKIAKKCRECKSKVCFSRGSVSFADGRSLNDMRHLEKIQDPHLTLMITGDDELRVMCDLVDIINHGTLRQK
jgi:phosphotransferase system HPr-like phosphotransfer protein